MNTTIRCSPPGRAVPCSAFRPGDKWQADVRQRPRPTGFGESQQLFPERRHPHPGVPDPGNPRSARSCRRTSIPEPARHWAPGPEAPQLPGRLLPSPPSLEDQGLRGAADRVWSWRSLGVFPGHPGRDLGGAPAGTAGRAGPTRSVPAPQGSPRRRQAAHKHSTASADFHNSPPEDALPLTTARYHRFRCTAFESGQLIL